MSLQLINSLLYGPVDGNSGTGAISSMPVMDATDLFNELSEGSADQPDVINLDNKDDKKTKTDDKITEDSEIKIEDASDETIESDEKEEELDELAELEQELQGPTDEQLELMPAPRRKEILKEFPELFKKFPYLEKAYYRDQQFTEVVPTIADAKEAVEKSKAYDNLSQTIESGDIKSILDTIIKKDKETFNGVVDKYLSTLHEVDSGAYLHVISNVTKHIAIEMVQEARRTGNEDLQKAAALMHQFAFGTSEFTPVTNLSKPKNRDNTKELELAKKEREFNQRRYDEAQNSLSTRVTNSIKSTIDKHIDPNNSMTEYVKKAAVKDALDNVNKYIAQDKRFVTLIDKLWEDAFKRGFDSPSLDKIRMACVSKAQTLLPTVIKSARNEALKGLPRRNKADEPVIDKTDKTDQKVRERSPSSKSKDSKGIPEGMSTAEYLLADD